MSNPITNDRNILYLQETKYNANLQNIVVSLEPTLSRVGRALKPFLLTFGL